MDFLNDLKNIEKLNENGMCQLCGMIAAVMEIGLESIKNGNSQLKLPVPTPDPPPVPEKKATAIPPVPKPTPWNEGDWVSVIEIARRTGVKKHTIRKYWLPESKRLPGFPLPDNGEKTSRKRWHWGSMEANWRERERLGVIDG